MYIFNFVMLHSFVNYLQTPLEPPFFKKSLSSSFVHSQKDFWFCGIINLCLFLWVNDEKVIPG